MLRLETILFFGFDLMFLFSRHRIAGLHCCVSDCSRCGYSAMKRAQALWLGSGANYKLIPLGCEKENGKLVLGELAR